MTRDKVRSIETPAAARPQGDPRASLVDAYVARLHRLASDGDRGALAALRTSLSDPNGMAAAACPIVLPFVPPGEDAYRDRVFFLTGALFALHPATGGAGVSLGHAFRKLNDRTEGPGDRDNESLRRRFVALLDSDPDDVGNHVRHAVSLARANEIPLDWARVLLDLWGWRSPSRYVQRRLAREFWKTPENALRAEGDASE